MVLVYVFEVLFILLAIAFFTLFEVRSLGGIHLRFGPNRVGVGGYFQPFGDFVSLFGSGFWLPRSVSSFLFLFSPLLCLFLGLLVWLSYGGFFELISLFWGVLLFFCLSGLTVFFFLFSGWSSGSVFSLLGSFRTAAQAVSYDVALLFIVVSVILISESYSVFEVSWASSSWGVFFCFPVLFVVWAVSCLAEANRSPFDFSEGESELVSGFNTEYLGGNFSFIFIAEYGFMLFLGYLTSLVFFGMSFFFLKQMMLVVVFVFSRASFPRMRFDSLMNLMWSSLLIVVLGLFVFSLGVGAEA